MSDIHNEYPEPFLLSKLLAILVVHLFKPTIACRYINKVVKAS